MANFDVLKNFITQRVYTNGTQAITGQVMQDTLLEMLKAWGYQFQGFATPETVPPATANDYRPYYLANAKGTYSNFGGAVLDGSTLAMLYYDGSWKSQVLSMGGGGGTGNFVTINTEQTITAKKTFTAAPHFNPASGSPFTVGNTTVVNSLNADLLDGFHNGQVNAQHLTLAADVSRVGGDFNTLKYMGVYSYGTPPCNNNPGGTGARGVLFQFSNSIDWVSQLAGGIDKNLYYRMGINNIWGEWSKLAFSSDLGNYVTLNTTQTITGHKFFSKEVGINNYNMAIYPTASRSIGILYRKEIDSSIYAGIGAQTTNSNEIEKLYMGWGSTPWVDSYNFCASSSYIKYKNNTVWHAGNDGSGSGLDADYLDGIHADGLFTALSNSSNYISMTIGGTTKTLVPAYATNAGNLGGHAPSYYATASEYVKKAGDTMTGTLTLDTIRSSARYLTFSTQLYIGNATDTNNTVNQGSIRTIGGISASLSIWAGKNITANGEITQISDIRTKSDIRSLTFRGGIRPVSFIKDGKRGIGFIAQEVQKLYPELVVEGADGLLSLNYAGYTAVLQSQVDNHETELQRLRGRVEELERRMRNQAGS